VGDRLRFTIDPGPSTVAVAARSSVHPLHGSASGVEGWVDVAMTGDRPDLSATLSARIELALERLGSGNAVYDHEMRRRVEAGRFPTVAGVLTGVEPAETEGRYHVRGDLTFHGRTRPVSADIDVRFAVGHLVADWDQTIDIRDFGVTPPRILMLKVHPEVRVTVHLEADEEPVESTNEAGHP
jgi:polyisoprenoid-binding protein YceI